MTDDRCHRTTKVYDFYALQLLAISSPYTPFLLEPIWYWCSESCPSILIFDQGSLISSVLLAQWLAVFCTSSRFPIPNRQHTLGILQRHESLAFYLIVPVSVKFLGFPAVGQNSRNLHSNLSEQCCNIWAHPTRSISCWSLNLVYFHESQLHPHKAHNAENILNRVLCWMQASCPMLAWHLQLWSYCM